MDFCIQQDATSCQYIALQIALSYYNVFQDTRTLKKCLPKHQFGNLITELGVYLESLGIRTILVSNFAQVRPANKLFWEKLAEYKKVGTYEDRLISEKDLTKSPIIVNTDWYKIKNIRSGKDSHYIVVNKENEIVWLYDGSNYQTKVETDLYLILAASKDINKWNDDGMWLVLK